jgi:iron(III) transport system permease protein
LAEVGNAQFSYAGWRPLRVKGENLAFSILLAFLLLLVAYPVFLLVLNSFQTSLPWQAPKYGMEVWRRAFASPGMMPAIFNTAQLVLAHQAISLAMAIMIAWLIARTDIPYRNLLEAAFWVSFFLPTLSTTLGWILLLDPQYGLLNEVLAALPFLQQGPFNIYSFWGIVAAHLLGHSISIKVMFLTPIFRNMDASLEEVARVAGSNRLSTLRRIFIPLMQPAIVAVFILGTIHSLEAFEIELVLGVPIRFYVYSTQLYTMLQWEPPDYGAATALSVAILLFIFPLILLQRRYARRRQFTTVTGRYREGLIRLGRWRYAGFAFVSVVAVLLTVVPLVMLVAGTFMRHFGVLEIADAWTLANWQRVLTDPLFSRSVWNTLIISLGSAIAAALVTPLLAYGIVRSSFFARDALDVVSWLPYAIPGILLGLSFVWLLLATPGLRWIYGTIAALVLINVVKSMPLGVQILKSNFLQLGKELEEASRMAGGSWWYTYRHVVMPLAIRTVIVVGILNFISGARDIGAVVLLVTSQTRPLSILMLDYLMDGSFEAATVIALLVTLLSTGVAFLARGFGFRIGIGERH